MSYPAVLASWIPGTLRAMRWSTTSVSLPRLAAAARCRTAPPPPSTRPQELGRDYRPRSPRSTAAVVLTTRARTRTATGADSAAVIGTSATVTSSVGKRADGRISQKIVPSSPSPPASCRPRVGRPSLTITAAEVSTLRPARSREQPPGQRCQQRRPVRHGDSHATRAPRRSTIAAAFSLAACRKALTCP
jgi:hypothetical protein